MLGVVKWYQRTKLLKWDTKQLMVAGQIRYVNLVGLKSLMDKIDTQGMSIPSEGIANPMRDIPPMPVRSRTVFTEEGRMELKQIIHEALDEREKV